MNQSVASEGRGGSPFGRDAVLALVLVGFATFLVMLYFIGAGDTGPRRGGDAHAAATGINGYAGLAHLLEARGVAVERTRRREGLDTPGLLILTPRLQSEADAIAQVLEDRRYIGPTLLILPKWLTKPPPQDQRVVDQEKVRKDWVQLVAATIPQWAEDLPEPFALGLVLDDTQPGQPGPTIAGLQTRARLPDAAVMHAEPNPLYDAEIVDSAGRILALDVMGREGSDFYDNAHGVMIVVEPDLVNNYALADPARASMALEVVEMAGYGDLSSVTFDMSLAGMGEATNLLTLAFEPPFLAATLCLILALIIAGWRAFLRFGPVSASPPELAYGKSHLVENSAGLIMRARRLRLLAQPYADLVQRKVARSLGLTRPDRTAIDEALATKRPGDPAFSAQVTALEQAERPADILRAARALDSLTRKLAR